MSEEQPVNKLTFRVIQLHVLMWAIVYKLNELFPYTDAEIDKQNIAQYLGCMNAGASDREKEQLSEKVIGHLANLLVDPDAVLGHYKLLFEYAEKASKLVPISATSAEASVFGQQIFQQLKEQGSDGA